MPPTRVGENIRRDARDLQVFSADSHGMYFTPLQ